MNLPPDSDTNQQQASSGTEHNPIPQHVMLEGSDNGRFEENTHDTLMDSDLFIESGVGRGVEITMDYSPYQSNPATPHPHPDRGSSDIVSLMDADFSSPADNARDTRDEGDLQHDSASTTPRKGSIRTFKNGLDKLVAIQPAAPKSGPASSHTEDTCGPRGVSTPPESGVDQSSMESQANLIEECESCKRSGAECETNVFQSGDSFYYTKCGTCCGTKKKCFLSKDWTNLREYQGDRSLIEDLDESVNSLKARRLFRSREAKAQAKALRKI